MLKAIKIRIYPDKEQENYIINLLGSSRFIYNQLLAFKINEYNENKNNISFGELGKKLVVMKNEYEWLRNSHSKVLQQSVINLDRAFKNFFINGSGFPKFKSKHNNKNSCRFPSDAISGIKGNRINLIKQLKNIHFKCSVKDEIYINKNQDLIKSITLTKSKSNKYYLSILIDKPNKQLSNSNNEIIGIDLGIKDFIITSNNEKYENIKIKRNNEKKLIKLNRNLSKKQKNSKNKNKARIKLAKFHEKLNNKKEYYLHSISNKLLNENQIIVIEDLNVIGMMKNHKLAKSIQELSLYKFKEMLKYKASWYGREIIEINRFFPSSKLCNCCGYKNNSLSLRDRNWICPECGISHDRDLNAAINILKEGIRMIELNKIGLSSPELTLVDNSTINNCLRDGVVKNRDWMKQEKNVF